VIAIVCQPSKLIEASFLLSLVELDLFRFSSLSAVASVSSVDPSFICFDEVNSSDAFYIETEDL
jgi:hypothetical protein